MVNVARKIVCAALCGRGSGPTWNAGGGGGGGGGERESNTYFFIFAMRQDLSKRVYIAQKKRKDLIH